MKKEKRGKSGSRWDSLAYYSKGTAIGAFFGIVVSVLLALFSYFDCSSVSCSIGNILFYTTTFILLGFLAGFIAGFAEHWKKHKKLFKVSPWEKTGMLFFIVNLIIFFGAVYEFYPLPWFLDVFYSFPMHFAEYFLNICFGPEACGAYAFMGFFVWISVAVLLLGALIGLLVDKFIIFLSETEQEIEFISHRHNQRQDRFSLYLIALLIAVIPFIILILNTQHIAFDMDFYRQEFMKYSPDIKNKEAITSNMLIFLQSEEQDTSLLSSFSQAEVSHLQDVRLLMQRFSTALAIAIALAIILLVLLCVSDMYSFVYDIGYVSVFGGALTSLLVFISYLWMLDFDSAFTAFHSIFFAPGTWQFPADSMLTTLMPGQFWVDISSKLVGNTLVTAVIVMGLGMIIMLLSKDLRKH